MTCLLICCDLGIPEPLKFSETDSDSIETISDDEILVAQSHANLASPTADKSAVTKP